MGKTPAAKTKRKTVTEENFTVFKKDILDVIKMHGNKIDEVLKKDPPPTSPIPNPNPKPNMPPSNNYICFCDIVMARTSGKPSDAELAAIKATMAKEMTVLMNKYKVSKVNALMLKVYD